MKKKIILLLPPYMAESLPIRISNDDENFIRLQYTFVPQTTAETTVSREVVIENKDSSTACVDHILQGGERERFKGSYKKNTQNMRECVFLFTDEEVVCCPLQASILQLRKVNNPIGKHTT